jgi:large subunit ribosomal protein L29
MRPKQIRELSVEEREAKLREWREELFRLRFQSASGQLEKPHRIRELKRDIARLLTVMKEKKS